MEIDVRVMTTKELLAMGNAARLLSDVAAATIVTEELKRRYKSGKKMAEIMDWKEEKQDV